MGGSIAYLKFGDTVGTRNFECPIKNALATYVVKRVDTLWDKP